MGTLVTGGGCGGGGGGNGGEGRPRGGMLGLRVSHLGQYIL